MRAAACLPGIVQGRWSAHDVSSRGAGSHACFNLATHRMSHPVAMNRLGTQQTLTLDMVEGPCDAIVAVTLLELWILGMHPELCIDRYRGPTEDALY